MRRYKPSYFVGQAFKGLWRNGVMSLASITVLLSCLIVMGCFALLVVNIDYNLDKIGDLNLIKIFVDKEEALTEGDVLTLAEPLIPENSGDRFLGWSTDPAAAEPQYRAGAAYTVSGADALAGNVTLYAIWDAQTPRDGYMMRYHGAGAAIDGPVPTDDVVYTEGAEVTLPDGPVSHYHSVKFLGWSLQPGSSEAQYAAGSYYYVNPDAANGGMIHFYAVWSVMPDDHTYTLSYDANRIPVKGVLPTTESVRINAFLSKIRALDNVASVEYTSPEEVMGQMYTKFVDAGFQDLADTLSTAQNPYRHEFSIVYSDNTAVSTLEYQLSHIEGVAKINCRTDYAERVESLKNGVILVFVWFMAILFVVSIFVIINTVKLAVYARRQEISIMRYVGATNWFISMPFIIEGVLIGLISSGIAYVAQFYMYRYVQKLVLSDIGMVSVINFADVKSYVLAGFLCIGILTGVFGSVLSLRKYLRA